MSRDFIKERLLEVQGDDDAIRIGELDRVKDLVAQLMTISPSALSDRLLKWEEDAPDAVNLLLKAAARSDESALHVARALVQVLTIWKDGVGPWSGVDEVLMRAFPKLEAPERDWVAERPAVTAKYKLVAGRDFEPMGAPNDRDQWPRNKPLPPFDDVRGVQARLLRAGYNSGPITGVFNDATRRAIVRYQVEHALPASGELDEATRLRLVDEE